MKKDIFKGKIKKEYFSYILGYMIFFMLLFVVGGALCIYAFVSEGSFHVSGKNLLLATFGAVSFALGGGYVFPQLFLIRNFPKYPKLRRIFFNSDIYFTESTSSEYFGGSRTLRGRRNKAAFDMVTTFAEAEKTMGNKKPIRYTVYSALSLIMAVLGLADLIAMPLLYEDDTIFSNISDDVFVFFYFAVALVCLVLAIFFVSRALKVAVMAPWENDRWKYELYTSLTNISVRRNNKKHKFWYKSGQLKEIENLIYSANKNTELKFERNGNRLLSFEVIDTLNERVIFKGFFI